MSREVAFQHILSLSFKSAKEKDYVLKELAEGVLRPEARVVSEFRQVDGKRSVRFQFMTEDERDAVAGELVSGLLGDQLDVSGDEDHYYVEVFIPELEFGDEEGDSDDEEDEEDEDY